MYQKRQKTLRFKGHPKFLVTTTELALFHPSVALNMETVPRFLKKKKICAPLAYSCHVRKEIGTKKFSV